MAEVQFTIISGSFRLPMVENTSSAGYMWFNTASNQVNISTIEWGGASPGTPSIPGGAVWTTGGALNFARRSLGTAGNSTSALAFGGWCNPGAVTGRTEALNSPTLENAYAVTFNLDEVETHLLRFIGF